MTMPTILINNFPRWLAFILVASAMVCASFTVRADSEGIGVLLVDLQECFVRGGALEVPGTDKKYINHVQRNLRWLAGRDLLMLASRDYHPEGHISFASSHPGALPYETLQLPDGRLQPLWPDHCVQTRGDSRLVVDNNLFFETIKKGGNKGYDSNSAFVDDSGQKTELDAILRQQGIKTLIVFGLATEVCVVSTIKDLLAAGYHVIFVEDLSRGLTAEGVESAKAEMLALGAQIMVDSKQLKSFLRAHS